MALHIRPITVLLFLLRCRIFKILYFFFHNTVITKKYKKTTIKTFRGLSKWENLKTPPQNLAEVVVP